jgi:hypothetical protein
VAAWPVSDWFLPEGERAVGRRETSCPRTCTAPTTSDVTSRLWRPHGLATGSSLPTGAATPTSARTSGAGLVPHLYSEDTRRSYDNGGSDIRSISLDSRDSQLQFDSDGRSTSTSDAGKGVYADRDSEAPTGAENNWMKTVYQDGWFVCFRLSAFRPCAGVPSGMLLRQTKYFCVVWICACPIRSITPV